MHEEAPRKITQELASYMGMFPTPGALRFK